MVADCCYGSGKSSVPVINISKRIRKKKNIPRDSRQSVSRVLSLIPILVSHNRHPECVGDDCWGPWVFGGWWWKGGRMSKAEQMTKREFNITM